MTYNMTNKRTNSLTAAALSIGVDADLLESLLPTLQGITAQIREGKASVGDVCLILMNEESCVCETGDSAYIALEPVKQCGIAGAGPCTCGE